MKLLSGLTVLAAAVAIHATAAYGVEFEYQASIIGNASSGEHAPYMLGSWNSGRVTGASGVWLDGLLEKKFDLGERFSWSAGVECMFGYGSQAHYKRFNDGKWDFSAVRQAPARLIQLYGELKYRGVYLMAGMKERHSGIVDDYLSSGDLTRSNNARPIPGVSAGFVDFQNIPFTNGWVQIEGEIMYGKFMDDGLREKSFNYYSGLFCTGNYYTYKRCYFRTKPSMPFSVTVGMQTAGEFAGRARYYRRGLVTREEVRKFHFKDIIDMFFPIEGSGEGYYKGNSLGSWDLKARYDFNNGGTLSAYFEWPWEDGSGIGKQNGWDGLWGLQYTFPESSPLANVVVEYFDFTNHSGPIHYAPADNPGSSITTGLTGGDNYYNNDFYGPYSNYGMSIGSPFVVSPLYNLSGLPGFMHNRARGVHIALEGRVGPELSYVAKFSYQKAGGTGRIPSVVLLSDTSLMGGMLWTPGSIFTGLSVRASVGLDTGSLRGSCVGCMLSLSYSGNFTLGRK